MDNEIQVWYENQFDLFSKPGWKDFIQQVEDIKKNTEDFNKVNDANQLFFVKGQLDFLNWILTWEDSVNKVYKELSGE